MKKKYLLLPAAIVAAVVLLLLAAGYYTDYLWFASMNATQVFLKPFLAELAIKALLFALGFAFVLVNLLPLAGKVQIQRLRVVDGMEIQRKRGLSKKVTVLIALGLSLFWVLVLPSLWDRVLLFLNAQPLGEADPVLGKDISFYFFTYPLLSQLSGAFIGLLVLTGIPVILGHVFGGGIESSGGKLRFSRRATAHISVLLALFLAWFALNRELAMAGMLVSPSASVFGAGYTDVHIRLPLLRIQQIMAAGLAIISLVNLRRRSKMLLAAAPALLLIVAIVGGLVAAGFQQFIVGPNQLVRETPYIEHHIAATRRGYNIHQAAAEQYPVEEGLLSRAVLEQNQATLNNIRLLDYRPLAQHYHQSQSLRLYYEFNDIDIDRYRVEDQSRQVMLSVRELNVESLPDQAQTLINRHFKYTHGYGVVMSPVNEVTANGHPTYFLLDLPVRSEVEINLERPEIYFGELTNQFVVVNTRGGEFSYQQEGEEEQIIRYQGEDGVSLSGFRRLLYALKFRKPILVLSDEITSESRILYYRNITERIGKLAPFLRLDSDCYPVVANGRVYWIADAYTLAGNYPYSERVSGGVNYIRNSVKAVVDAYDGTVDLYLFDQEDPLINAWRGVFPGLFKERSQIPAYLEEHIRYPLDLFETQAEILQTYHMTNPRDFYNRENVWEIAVEQYGNNEVQVEPYYVTMQMPDGEAPEFILKLPFTPYNRNNMVGWLAAGNDGENYGRLWLHEFSRGTLIDGPSQVEAFIDQDPEISQQISLWDRGGSEVVRGNLLTIPLDGQILYVEPLFILAESRSVPELRRIIVYYNDILVMEPTLDGALARIFAILEEGEDPGPVDPGPVDPEEIVDPDLKALVQSVIDIYAEMEQAAREGRWADYGSYGDQLEQLLQQLEELVSEEE